MIYNNYYCVFVILLYLPRSRGFASSALLTFEFARNEKFGVSMQGGREPGNVARTLQNGCSYDIMPI